MEGIWGVLVAMVTAARVGSGTGSFQSAMTVSKFHQ